MQAEDSQIDYPFLRNGGEPGKLIKEFNWSETTLGPINNWLPELTTTLGIILISKIPMFIVWESENFLFFNDAFKPLIDSDAEYSYTLGKSVDQVLTNDWNIVLKTINEIKSGVVTSLEDQITLYQENKKNNSTITVGYAPLFNVHGNIQGLLVTCNEKTIQLRDNLQCNKVSQFKSTYTYSGSGIARADISGKLLEVNDRYCEMLGYSREDLLKMTVGDLTHRDDMLENVSLLQDCINNGNDFIIAKRYIRRDGSILWVNNCVCLMVDSTGQKYIRVIASDIHEQKEKEDQVQTSERRFRSLIDKAPVATALFRGREFIVELANDRMLGYWQKGERVIGSKLKEIFPEIGVKEFYSQLQEVFATGVEYRTSSSSTILGEVLEDKYFDYSITALLNEESGIDGILYMCNDVTGSMLEQHKAEKNQRVISAMFEQSSVAIATISTEKLIFQSANSFYGELVGRPAEEIIGKSLLDALPELKGQGFDELLKSVVTSENPFIAREVEVKLFRYGKLEKIYVDLTYQINRNATENNPSILVIATDVTQQVVSRREVEESESRLKDLIAAAPAGIGLFVGRDLIIDYPNQTFIDIVGKGPDIKGLPLREAMPELITEGQEYLKILDDIFTTGVPFISSASLVKIVQDGVLKNNYYNISYTPLRNTDGDIYAILDIAIDVTAQVIAQHAMKESEAHLELLRDTVPAMIFYLDQQQRYRSYNTVFMDWFFVNKEEALGKTVLEFIGQAAYEKALPHLEAAYGGQQEKYEMHAPSRMGIDRWLSIVYTPHINNEGNVIGLIVHATDITKSKKDEIALRESIKKIELAEQSLLNAVEMAELGTWKMDFATGITYVSDRHAEMFGMRSTRVTMQEVIAIIDESDRDRVASAFFGAQQIDSDGKFDSEYKIINPVTGRIQIIHAVGQTNFDNEGQAVSISGTAQDITIHRELQLELENQVQLRTKELAKVLEELQISNSELEQTNEALLHSNEELSQFAYVASHDLQEPLRKIRIFAGMLAEGRSPLRHDEMINKIGNSAGRMSLLIDDLLAFSRLTKPEKVAEFVSIQSVLQNIWVDFELAVQETNAEIIMEKLPTVQAVGLQMNQLFYNLISNSLKFRHPNIAPKITVKSNLVARDYLAQYTASPLADHNYHHIIFTDNGIGFEKDYETRIFEIFKRLHTQNIYPGSGIGLALCKRIVLNHNGVLFAESELGKGSTFHIFLPDIPL